MTLKLTCLICTLHVFRNFTELNSSTDHTNIDIQSQHSDTISEFNSNLSATTSNYQEKSTTTSKLLYDDKVTENISKLLKNLIQKKEVTQK